MLILLTVAQLAAGTGALPAKFVGLWTDDLTLCGKEDTGGVVIGPAAITFYEARGKVRAVSSRDGTISAAVDYAGESRTWSETNSLRLDGHSRLVLKALGKTTTLARCPSKSGN